MDSQMEGPSARHQARRNRVHQSQRIKQKAHELQDESFCSQRERRTADQVSQAQDTTKKTFFWCVSLRPCSFREASQEEGRGRHQVVEDEDWFTAIAEFKLAAVSMRETMRTRSWQGLRSSSMCTHTHHKEETSCEAKAPGAG